MANKIVIDLKNFYRGVDFPGEVNCGKMSLSNLEHHITMMRKEILKKHKAAITELSSGRYKGYYQTYVIDPNTGKRKNVRGKTEKAVKDKLVDFYIQGEEENNHTVEKCFDEWIDYLKINRRQSTIHSYVKVFKRHFSEIKDKNIEDLTAYDIKIFIKKEVADKKLTSKSYASLKTDVLGIFNHAADKGYIDIRISDIMQDVSRQLRGSFAKTKKAKKSDEELIFYDDEITELTEYCVKSDTLVDLGILLIFGTGLRVGELAALKPLDVESDFRAINVSRTEERVGNGAEYIVIDNAKTDAGIRKVLLTSDVSVTIQKILEKSYSESEYLFSDAEIDRYPSKKFRDRLYRLCKILGIPLRSPHDIRRTYATKLYEAGVPEDLIIKQMGHIDFDITKSFYIYNRRNREEMISELERAL